MRERILALIEAGAADQITEVIHSITNVPLPDHDVALLRALCAPVHGPDWFLIDLDGQGAVHRARLVRRWLERWSLDPGTDPVSAWLARHATAELKPAPHLLQEGTASLLRQHLPDPAHRHCIDLVSEDRVDWQRDSAAHRSAAIGMAADWLAALLSDEHPL